MSYAALSRRLTGLEDKVGIGQRDREWLLWRLMADTLDISELKSTDGMPPMSKQGLNQLGPTDLPQAVALCEKYQVGGSLLLAAKKNLNK